MLVLLPFQFVWGAAAGYCQHEEGATAVHFGHHAHKHQGKVVKLSGQSSTDRASVADSDDYDCGYCHLACLGPIASGTATPLGMDSDRLVTSGLDGPPLSVLSTIDRPNWTLAA